MVSFTELIDVDCKYIVDSRGKCPITDGDRFNRCRQSKKSTGFHRLKLSEYEKHAEIFEPRGTRINVPEA